MARPDLHLLYRGRCHLIRTALLWAEGALLPVALPFLIFPGGANCGDIGYGTATVAGVSAQVYVIAAVGAVLDTSHLNSLAFAVIPVPLLALFGLWPQERT